jgi:phosphotransferase system HPr (HPr) family protein
MSISYQIETMFRRPLTRQVVVTYPKGIHVRPSVAIVKAVHQYQSKVALRYGDRQADASDVLAILALGVPTGAELTLMAEGLDAQEALDNLSKLFAEDFGMQGK